MEADYARHILLLGGIVILVILMRPVLQRWGLPVLVGHIMLGFTIRLADSQWGLLGSSGFAVFEFLAYVGVVVLLFRIGLESDIAGLLQRLPSASMIWIGDVLISGLLGFVVAYYLLDWDLIPSLFTATALTATSVGISVTLWEESGKLNTDRGQLLLEVAEMDDISGVILMGLLFSLAPVLYNQPDAPLALLIAQTLGEFLLTFALFTGACILFSRYAEERMTAYFESILRWPTPSIMVLAVGMIVAATAALIGFSMAIGAFFAGLIFSRDPDAVKLDASYAAIHPVFSAFFFIGIGLHVSPDVLGGSVLPVVFLFGAAVAGKFLGAFGPALALTGGMGAVLIGVSLVPRAEIMLIIMQHGLDLGAWAVTPERFTYMVLVSTATVLVVPPAVRALLHHQEPTVDAS